MATLEVLGMGCGTCVGLFKNSEEAARQQVELQREKLVARLAQLRGARRHDDEQTRVVEPPRQVSQEIGRRRVGPLHVVEPEHDRL